MGKTFHFSGASFSSTAVNIFGSQDSRGNRGILGVGVPASAGPLIRFPDRLKAGLQQMRPESGVRVLASAGPLIQQDVHRSGPETSAVNILQSSNSGENRAIPKLE